MDVHDVGDYKIGNQWRVFEPGMALTIEPGIYVAPGTPGAPRKFSGIGIRIEDDVVVTRDGCEVLTERCPKEAIEIERLMASVA
jgi:Xaa-Pro aminopeptidase